MAAMVKGFGCRPVLTYLRALRAGVRKPPRKEPAGAGRQCRPWGFDDAGACVVDALAGEIGGGSTIAVLASKGGRAADTAYALGSLQIRQYDPLGNLRKAGE
jgi:hypothetical protein